MTRTVNPGVVATWSSCVARKGGLACYVRPGQNAVGLTYEELANSGNLTNVKNNAKFDFGVAMLPAGKQRGSPTGGGNFYIFAKSTPAQRDAAMKFIKWVTTPARAAQWGIDTGYVAVSPAAYETAAMKAYAAEFPPALVARDQLPHAVAELSTHENQRVTKALNDGLQAALTGTKTPQKALEDAQAEAERILKPYR